MDDFVSQHPNRLVKGIKQFLRELRSGNVQRAIVASDSDAEVFEEIVCACRRSDVPFETVPSKVELGQRFGVMVGCSVIGFCKTDVPSKKKCTRGQTLQ